MTLDLKPLNKPEIVVTFAGDKFDQQGNLIDEGLREEVRAQLAAFEHWIRLLKNG